MPSTDVDAAFTVRQRGRFMGQVLSVLQRKNGDVCLFSAHRPADELGVTNTEPVVYQKWVPADQVEIWEERTPFRWIPDPPMKAPGCMARSGGAGEAADNRGVVEVSIQPYRGWVLAAGLFALGVALNEWKFLMGLVVGVGTVQAAGWLQIHWLTGVITVGVIYLASCALVVLTNRSPVVDTSKAQSPDKPSERAAASPPPCPEEVPHSCGAAGSVVHRFLSTYVRGRDEQAAIDQIMTSASPDSIRTFFESLHDLCGLIGSSDRRRVLDEYRNSLVLDAVPMPKQARPLDWLAGFALKLRCAMGSEPGMIPYPLHSDRNPFSRTAPGRFFAYLTNRYGQMTYLSSRGSDFDYNNPLLYRSIPMGYTNLCILMRVALAEAGGYITVWENEPGSWDELRLMHWAGEECQLLGGAYANLKEATLAARREAENHQTPVLVVAVHEEYYWH
ncbi:MAG: hypothetical protein ACOY94_03590 [Bacillota bacterium]